MTNLKIITIVAAFYFAFFGSWPFENAVHGDGSTTTQIDYFIHAGGIVVFLFIALRALVDVIYDGDDKPERGKWEVRK